MKFTGAILLVSVGYLASFISCVPVLLDDLAPPPTSFLSITSPLRNTAYQAGSEMTISWTNPERETIDYIKLAAGYRLNYELPVIATNITALDLKYVWKIPSDIQIRNDYSLRFWSSGNYLDVVGYFSIEAGVDSVTNKAV